MAKTSSVEKNNRRRRMVKQFASKRAKLKAAVMDKSLPVEERFEATIKLAAVPRNSAKNRIRNRCELTGRARGYYRKTQLCRIAMRDLAALGQIPGMVKASW
jgi:small subunit ribosomal protein S14